MNMNMGMNMNMDGGTNTMNSSTNNHDFTQASIYWKNVYDIEDEEIMCRLAHSIQNIIDKSEIHPVSRLCWLKGRTCDEGSNPSRAVTFLKLALWIDIKCIEAWDYLRERHLLTWEEERDLLQSLRFGTDRDHGDDRGDDHGDGDEDGVEWLKDVYMVSLTNWSMTGSNTAKHRGHNSDKNGSGGEGVGGDDDGGGGGIHLPNGAFTPIHMVMDTTLGPSPIIPVLPEQPAINFSMDASAIQFQPTPLAATTSFNFAGESGGGSNSNIHNGHYRKRSDPKFYQQKSSPSAASSSIVKDVETAFQNLHIKHHLSQSPEILTIAATRAYNSYNLPLALHYCQTLHEKDPLCSTAANIQIATLTGLGHKRPLFRLAHALVDADPKSAMSWYAVGCYYYTCQRFDLAQRHFCRATRLDPRSAECWIGFGCSFALCDENDQANACFRAAQRLYAGSHYPMLYMGMEHLRTNNIPLAGHFLNSARSMGRDDPLCCNELGVWAYRKKEWLDAINWFILALRIYVEHDVGGGKAWAEWDNDVKTNVRRENRIMEEEGRTSSFTGQFSRFDFGGDGMEKQSNYSNLSDRDCVEFCEEAFWEPTIFNLGQSYRKARRFHEASMCFEKCLALCPGNAMTYSALGFTRHLVGDLEVAIESYHQALSHKPDDPFASEMLNRSLYEALDDLGGPTSTAFLSTSTNDGSFGLPASPMTPINHSAMSIGSTISSAKVQNSAHADNNGSIFTLGDSDVDMSTTL